MQNKMIDGKGYAFKVQDIEILNFNLNDFDFNYKSTNDFDYKLEAELGWEESESTIFIIIKYKFLYNDKPLQVLDVKNTFLFKDLSKHIKHNSLLNETDLIAELISTSINQTRGIQAILLKEDKNIRPYYIPLLPTQKIIHGSIDNG